MLAPQGPLPAIQEQPPHAYLHFLELREEREGPSESAAPPDTRPVGFPLWKALLGRHAATSTEIQSVLQALREAEPAATGSQTGAL